MASHKALWGAITSHEKWIFVRLHPGDEPYISFSSIELQSDSTRPFRALLAIMLAAELDLDVESHSDMRLAVERLEEGGEQENVGEGLDLSHEDLSTTPDLEVSENAVTKPDI